MNSSEIPQVDPSIPPRAVSIYDGGDAADDFPVLKAFQQYIDAEQAKARKRIITLGIFFVVVLFVTIGVFVALLLNISARNQQLNDRLVDFAMRDRGERGAAVVVQPPTDNSALMTLNAKLDDMQKKLEEERRRTAEAEKQAKAAAEAEKKAEMEAAKKPKGPSPSELEVIRLKKQLLEEQNKAAELKNKQREAELEEYRRKHYPELYAPKVVVKKPAVQKDEALGEDVELEDLEEEIERTPPKKIKTKAEKKQVRKNKKQKLEDLDTLLDDLDDEDQAVSYFDDDDSKYTIPVEIKGKRSKWRIPED